MKRANLILNIVLVALVLGNIYAWSCAIIAELEKPIEVEEPTSWEVYCAKYGVDENNPTSEQETYYMDCYAGSTEEEEELLIVTGEVHSENTIAPTGNAASIRSRMLPCIAEPSQAQTQNWYTG